MGKQFERSLELSGRQLELVRRRRDEIAALESELLSRRKKAQSLLRESRSGEKSEPLEPTGGA